MQPPSSQSFHRGSNRILGGVCSGLAEGFRVDVLWVRLVFVVLAFVQGLGILLYVILWILMPERTDSRSAGQNAFDSMVNDIKRAWSDLRAQFGGVRSPMSRATSTAAATPGQSASGTTATGSGQAAPPVQPSPPALPPQQVQSNPSFVLGAILIAIGIAFLVVNTGLVDWSVIWPVALVGLGIVILIRNLEKRSG
jgi:phage shock protein PspC (stress-responsive transcriptional regulator)